MTAPPHVTALRSRGPTRVEVDLDGVTWRALPVEAVLAAGLAVGVELDRVRAREVGRQLRRLEGRAVALRALRRRDHTAASLEQRLARLGTAPTTRREAVEAVQRAGLVDDHRFARGRAELLARRGSGDLLIADDLECQGVPPVIAAETIAALDPEAERAAALIAALGRTPQTARRLAARGFAEETLEALVADLESDRLG
jgi:SOS response regulatory protein OraA/RecX